MDNKPIKETGNLYLPHLNAELVGFIENSRGRRAVIYYRDTDTIFEENECWADPLYTGTTLFLNSEKGLECGDILIATKNREHPMYIKVNGIAGNVVFLSPEYSDVNNAMESNHNLITTHIHGEYLKDFSPFNPSTSATQYSNHAQT